MTEPHILFITGEYPPMEGGVGAYTQELGRALTELGARVSVLTGRDARQAGQAGPMHVYPAVERWGPAVWRRAPALAREAGADWLHVQYQTAAYAMNPAINFAPDVWRRTAPDLNLAWTYHDLLVPYLFPKAGAGIRKRVTVRPARRAQVVVATNRGDALLLEQYAGDRLHQIAIGSNITGVTLGEEERRRVRARYGYDDGDVVLAYFGFLNRSKGGATLIRTLARLHADRPDVRLLMIGERVGASDPTNFAYLQEVETLIDALGVGPFVRWTGRLDDADVAAALNACDILLMPYEDGAALRRGTLMAGLANGCAIVTTTPQSPLPELADERELLYFAPGNDQAAARVITRLLDLPALARRLRTNARAAARLFAWDRIAQEHLAMYAACRTDNA
ncbi:MAG: glycosyltransferase family 4 protein [Caldilineaceae bacterium]|nr:glycosyltransferase family 4 protein [Caldilineaceae bacterium]